MKSLKPGETITVIIIPPYHTNDRECEAEVCVTRSTSEADFVEYKGKEYEIYYRFPNRKVILLV